MKPVVIVGGGITGLVAAYDLERRGVPYLLLEESPRWGGKIRTLRERGLTIEAGPDAFGTYLPDALNLCRDLGLNDTLIEPSPRSHRVCVWDRGRLRRVPDGMMSLAPVRLRSLLATDLISWRGKLRMGWDYFIPPGPGLEDESLASFMRRRLGEAAVQCIAAPLLAGIHAADADDLSLMGSFPRFYRMEQQYGGLVRAWLAQRRSRSRAASAPRPFLLAPAGGMQAMVEALLAHLSPRYRRVGARVHALEPDGAHWRVWVEGDAVPLEAEHVICAAPAFVAADLVAGFDPELAAELAGLRYQSLVNLALAFPRAAVRPSVRGLSFMVNPRAGRRLRACTWVSEKFDARAPADVALARVAIRLNSDADEDDDRLIALACRELADFIGLRAEPEYAAVMRLPRAIPHLQVGHPDRVRQVEHRLRAHPGLHLAGAAYHGAGVPQCIADARRTVDTVTGVLESRPLNLSESGGLG